MRAVRDMLKPWRDRRENGEEWEAVRVTEGSNIGAEKGVSWLITATVETCAEN
jgi:hypothetical protein